MRIPVSIRGKILAGNLAIALSTVTLGLFATRAEGRLGALALDIYDNAFMAMSYLRAAQVEFSSLAVAEPRARPSDDASADLLSDLDVAEERAMSQRGRAEVIALRRKVAAALPLLATDRTIAPPVEASFERTVETFADDGFQYRRRVGTLVTKQLRQTTIAIVAAMLAALAVTALLGRLIAPPVLRAVRIAQSIAGGRLDNPIATSGRGETSDLLRSLAIMQASIASAMARIKALMEAQTATHADEIAARNAQMAAALENMNQGLCLFDADNRLLVSNRRFAAMFGAPSLGAFVPEVLEAAGLASLVGASGGTIETLSCDLPDGRSIAVSQRGVVGGGWVATYEDVSERREAETRLFRVARHDPLTGLANRLLFGEQLAAALARGKRGAPPALFCLNLHRFKAVNESLGHAAGDALLRVVSERLQACVRECDHVARLGGDEFAIVQEAATPATAVALARRLTAVVAAPFEFEGQQVEVGVSVGIALADETAITGHQVLLTCADLALRRAKTEEPGCFRFFEAGMDAHMQARRSLEKDLRTALAQSELELFYQPLVSAGGGISGFEALLRWRHPERGLVGPAEFIPIAEEAGLIGLIGDWVLQHATATAASWPGDLKVAVNLSGAQFRGRRLAADIAAALAASGLAPRRLEVEITESVLLQDDEHVLRTLHDIRAQGVRVAMDDFGTGFSSLGYLARFPFDKIKIDQSFVRGLTIRPDCLAIVRAVIGLGRSLGMSVNAEGVETEAQRDALTLEGCGELQGYLFSRPRPEAAVSDMLSQHEGARGTAVVVADAMGG